MLSRELNDSLKKPTPRSKLREIYGFCPSGPAVVLRGVFSEPCSELQGMIKFKLDLLS